MRSIRTGTISRGSLAFALISLVALASDSASAKGLNACDPSQFRTQYELYKDNRLKNWIASAPKDRFWYMNHDRTPRVISANESPFRVGRQVAACASKDGDELARYFITIADWRALRRSHYGETYLFTGLELRDSRRVLRELYRIVGSGRNRGYGCNIYNYDCETGLPEAWFAISLIERCLGNAEKAVAAGAIPAQANVRNAQESLDTNKTFPKREGQPNVHLGGCADGVSPYAIVE